jgi:hypothetical protein
MLYDPAQAQQKSNPSQRRETLCISEICWPQTWCLWLDGVANSREDGSPRFSQREVLALVYHLFLFTPAEIEHFAGPCIRFKIRPMVIHRLHRTFVDSRKERETLYVNIILSYRDFKVAQ